MSAEYKVPTKKVKDIESGTEMVINASDFNKELHEEIKPAKAKVEPETKPGKEGVALEVPGTGIGWRRGRTHQGADAQRVPGSHRRGVSLAEADADGAMARRGGGE